MFSRRRYITARVSREEDPITQFFLWSCIDMLPVKADYLQVFELDAVQNGLKVIHTQGIPEYKKEYLIPCKKPLSAKIFIIDDGQYATMLFADEY